ncbi:MAG: DUF7933 domain-containing protein [Burkholderiales bacterium]
MIHTLMHLRRWLALLALALSGLVPATAWAQASGCTALWGISNSATVPSIAYLNRSTNAFVNLTAPTVALVQAGGVNTTVSSNAIGAFGGTGALYFSGANQRANNPGMIRAAFNNVTGTVTFTNLGAISIPQNLTFTTTAGATAFASVTNFIGGSFDNSVNGSRVMYLLATAAAAAVANAPIAGTSTTSSPLAMIGLLDPDTPGTTSWRTIVQTTGTGTVTYPLIGTSGDIYFDRTNQALYYITNSTPVRFLRLAPNRTGLTLNSVLVSTTATFQVGGVNSALNTFGLALDPAVNRVYFTDGTGNNNYLLDAGAQGNTPAVNSTLAGAAGAAYGDTGSCIDQPLLPTVSKSFTPATSGFAIGSSTLTITISNPNLVPIFLNTALQDAFPAGMVVRTPLNLSSQCFSDGAAATRPARTSITATISAGSATIANGSWIPGGSTSGGSCSFSVSVSATIANEYPNTIPVGSLTTTAGNNAAEAAGTYTLRITDFQAFKSQRTETVGATTSAALTVPGGGTMQYILTVFNNGPVTGTTTFTDTIPALLTPSLAAITAVATGGGTCSTLTSVVTGQLRITGTFASAPAGAFCTITVTQRGSSTLSTIGSATNTITVSSSPTFEAASVGSDRTPANNVATVTTFINPSANVQISKTDGLASVQSGSTVGYTVTIANLGPAAMPGAVFLDPVATGLNCTTVTFASTPVGSITTNPSPLTLTALQSTGVSLTPTFPANSTATFRITCTVTATGQ